MQLFSHSRNNVPQEAEQIVFAIVHLLYLTGEKGPKKIFFSTYARMRKYAFSSYHVLYALIANSLICYLRPDAYFKEIEDNFHLLFNVIISTWELCFNKASLPSGHMT